MTTSGAGQCTVCETRTSTRCSGCKEALFCSPACQKLVWQTHKWWCGKDPNIFLLPPLDEAEFARFSLLKDRQDRRGGSFLGHYRSYKTWEDLLSTLQALSSSSSTLSIPEQAALILDARAHLKHCHSPRNDRGLPSPWQESIPEVDLAITHSMGRGPPSASRAAGAGTSPSSSFLAPPLEVFTDLNAYLRHVVLLNMIMCHGMVLQSKGKSVDHVEEKGHVAAGKMRAKIEACKASPGVKAFLRSLQEE